MIETLNFKVALVSYDKLTLKFVLMYIFKNSDDMLSKPRMLSFLPIHLINSIIHEHICEILYFHNSDTAY